MIIQAKSGNYSDSQFQRDSEIWLSLKSAIANSSGFKSWQKQQPQEDRFTLEEQVNCYLRETLNTLAY
jgi:hypothetical protein